MSFNRRRMLMVSLGGACLATGLGGWLSSRQSSSDGSTLIEVSRRGWALGTDVTMTVLADSTERAEQSLDDAFAELETVERVMSLYRPDSQICRLNRDKVLSHPHPYLLDVLLAGQSIAQQSSGAFDVTVQPLWKLHAECRRHGQGPSATQIAAARKSVRWQSVEIGRDIVRLNAPVEAITLNGIAQGFAADRALAALQRAGIAQALINTGEIGSLGVKSAARPWNAGIQHPRDPDAYAEVISLDGRSLATSGDYATTFSADFARNHIFDPRTGLSPRDLASASIVAPSGMLADGLSTAAMVLGAELTMAFVGRMADVDALLILKSGQTLRTPGFPLSAVL